MSIQTDDPKREFLNLMNHDTKLWNMAEKVMDGSNMILTLRNVPWGIGDLEVTLEGMDNAIAKRNAVGAFAQYIRSEVDERINDEAVTARAAQDAAFARANASELSMDRGNDRGSAGVAGAGAQVQEVANQKAVSPFGQIEALGSHPATRLSDLRRFVEQAEAVIAEARDYIAKYNKEIKALEAYMRVLNEQETYIEEQISSDERAAVAEEAE